MKIGTTFEHVAMKKCPRCGSFGKLTNERHSYLTPMWAVKCNGVTECFRSPEYETKRDAVSWWNVRPRRKIQK